MNHFINISDLNKDELRSIIDSAKKKKSERGKKSASQPDNEQPLWVFEYPVSPLRKTRTKRSSFPI